ncbi:MAG: ATP-binding protein [Candidatus Omnitrophota bacterium]
MKKDKGLLLREKLAWVPVFLFSVGIAVLYWLKIKVVAESFVLMSLFNFVFCAPVAFLVSYIAARGYLVKGNRYLLFMGASMLAWGLAAVLVLLEPQELNTLFTVHNVGIFLASVGCLASAVSASNFVRSRKNPSEASDLELAASYAGIMVFMLSVLWASHRGLTPPFFVPGRGPTVLCYLVLGVAVIQFMVAAFIFRLLYVRLRLAFLQWYSLGLMLFDIGLLGVWLSVPGTPLNWTAWTAQYLAGLYIFISVFCERRRLSKWTISFEKAFQESQERYKNLFENMNEAFALHEIVFNEKSRPVDYRFLEVNPAFEKLTGLASDKIVGKRMSEVLPGSEPYWLETYSGVALTGEPVRFERFYSEITRWFEVFAYRPSLNHFAVIFRDITERKHVEIKVNHLASFPQNNPNPVLEMDRSGKVIYANQAAIKTLERLKAAGKTELYFPQDLPQMLSLLYSGEEKVFSREVVVKDAIFYETVVVSPSLRVIRIYAQDITERKHVEGILRKNEEILNKLNRTLTALSRSSQAMIRAENESDYLHDVCKIVIEDCGHSMVWIGYAEQDGSKRVRPVAQAGFEEGYLKSVNISWADTESGRGPTGMAIRTGKPSFCRNMMIDPNFEPWRQEALRRGYASSIVLPLISDNAAFGAINIYSKEPDPFTEKEVQLLSELADNLAYGIMAIRLRVEHSKAEDILQRDKDTFERLVQERTKELVEAQAELERTKRLSDIGTLAATVAHELRNPLAAMGLAAFNIRRKVKNQDIDKHLANIEKKIIESEQIINNLLFYSRLKPPHYDRVPILEILEESIELLEDKRKNDISVIRDTGSLDGQSIEADTLQVKEVFNNILNNACDAVLANKGEIRVIAGQDDDSVVVTIKDNGAGIDKDNLAKVFDPFFTTKSKGTGLGLSVCRQIVDFHGGSISIESEAGRGTAVIVSLPKKKEKCPLNGSW